MTVAERRDDELLALQAILDDKVVCLDDDEQGRRQLVLTVDQELEQDIDVVVRDLEPAPTSHVEKLEALSLDSAERPRQHQRRRRGGRGGRHDGQLKALMPDAEPFKPQRISQNTELTVPGWQLGESQQLRLRYLPPVRLRVALPLGYPEEQAPAISIESEGWIVRDDWHVQVLEQLRGLWAGDESLFMAIEACQAVSIMETLGLKAEPLRLNQERSEEGPLSAMLKQHDRLQRSTAFAAENFMCGVCLNEKKGHRCVRLSSCQHVFCLECLVSFFTLLIREGLVRQVHCPSPECVAARNKRPTRDKPDAEPDMNIGIVTEDELMQIVGPELTKRYKDLSLKQRLESDPSMAYCPREACQAPVPKAADDEKLRICDACGFAFCVFCKRAWHGTRNACAIPQSSAIVDKWLSGTSDERAELELRYGVANMRRLVAIVEEERANAAWIEANSTACPGCASPVQKSQGCSHMQCARCHTHFCFRCGSSLSPSDPYKHFSSPGSRCYNKLFEFTPGNEPHIEEWIGTVLVD